MRERNTPAEVTGLPARRHTRMMQVPVLGTPGWTFPAGSDRNDLGFSFV